MEEYRLFSLLGQAGNAVNATNRPNQENYFWPRVCTHVLYLLISRRSGCWLDVDTSK